LSSGQQRRPGEYGKHALKMMVSVDLSGSGLLEGQSEYGGERTKNSPLNKKATTQFSRRREESGKGFLERIEAPHREGGKRSSVNGGEKE